MNYLFITKKNINGGRKIKEKILNLFQKDAPYCYEQKSDWCYSERHKTMCFSVYNCPYHRIRKRTKSPDGYWKESMYKKWDYCTFINNWLMIPEEVKDCGIGDPDYNCYEEAND